MTISFTGASLDVITFLTQKYPNALQAADDSKMLPLHYAIINNLPFATIKYLIECYPEALCCVNSDNWTPYHLIMLHCTHMEVFQFLRKNRNEEFKDVLLQFTIESNSKQNKRSMVPLSSTSSCNLEYSFYDQNLQGNNIACMREKEDDTSGIDTGMLDAIVDSTENQAQVVDTTLSGK